ncbi:hypothetical protein ACLK19_21520 [Escherichia coli]
MVRSGTVLLVLSDRNIAKIAYRSSPDGGSRDPDPSGRSSRVAMPTSSSKPPAPAISHHFAVLLGFRRDGYLSIPCL